MKLYFVEGGTAYNYILAVTRNGVFCNHADPDGTYASVPLSSYDNAGEKIPGDVIARRIFDAVDPDLDDADFENFSTYLFDTLEEWQEENDRFEPYNQDTLYLIGDFPH